jgi:agmatinase
MLTREVLRGIRQIVAAVDLAGMDIVEVSPPYDHAETTAMIANRAALEAISALAVRRRAGKQVRWAGVDFPLGRFPASPSERHGHPG